MARCSMEDRETEREEALVEGGGGRGRKWEAEQGKTEREKNGKRTSTRIKYATSLIQTLHMNSRYHARYKQYAYELSTFSIVSC